MTNEQGKSMSNFHKDLISSEGLVTPSKQG